MTPASIRILFLEDDGVLGWPDEDCHNFHLAVEFWWQLQMMHKQSFANRFTDKQSMLLANRLAKMNAAGDEGWQIHMAAWNDEERDRVRAFIRFLRDGAFYVADSYNRKHQRPKRKTKLKSSKSS